MYPVYRFRRSLVRPSYEMHQQQDNSKMAPAGLPPPVHFNGSIRFKSEPYFDAKLKPDRSAKHMATVCHLNLEGVLDFKPEYRSEFVPFPIEKSMSIPQLNNIQFHGKFGGVPEYRDSFRNYDLYAKSAPIKKPDHRILNNAAANDGVSAEYTEKFKAPDGGRSVQTKRLDQFNLCNGGAGSDEYNAERKAEYSESFADPKVTMHPERAKARASILSLNGNMDYSPEYRYEKTCVSHEFFVLNDFN